MKNLVLILLFLAAIQISFAQALSIGDVAPDFTLKNVDESSISLHDYNAKKGVIIVFTCNHCPYAKAYEHRIKAIQEKYGHNYPVIAINPNDETAYPEDSFAEMKKRAKSKHYNFPYLRDDSQQIAKSYGAKKTPHVYVLQNTDDGFKVRYIGAIDDNYIDAKKVKKKYLEEALNALDEGKLPSPSKTIAVGCSVKWKS